MDSKRSIPARGRVRAGTVAALPARAARDALTRSALITLLAVGLGMILVAWAASRQLQFSSAYLTKSLLVFAAGALLMRVYLPAHHPFPTLGAANTVTLVRTALVAMLAGLMGEHAAVAPLAATVIAVDVIVLDGLDGWLARRTRMSSAFGARFDMETDAALVAVLAVLTWQFGKAGVWVLLSGAMRYLFAAAAAFVPLLRRPLPSGYRGKSIAVIQMLVLVAAIAPGCSASLAGRLAAVGLGCLMLSFLLDIVWLVRHAR